MAILSNGSALDLETNGTHSGGHYSFGETFQNVLLSISLIGMVDNIIVCYVICRVKALQNLTNAFVFNQAVVDTLASFLIVVNHLVDPTNFDGFGGQILCRVWKSRFLMWACFTTSTYSLLAMTFERYFAIVYPLRYISAFTAGKVRAIIATVWVFSFVSSTYPIFLRSVSPDGVCLRTSGSITARTAISLYVFIYQYLLPLLLMAFAYIRIATTLGKTSKAQSLPPPSTSRTADTSTQGSPVNQARQATINKARKNVFKAFCLVFFAYVICWTPNQVYFMVFYVLDLFGNFSWRVHEITIILAYCNSCINPLIYALKYRSFRAGLRKAFFCNNSVDDSSFAMA